MDILKAASYPSATIYRVAKAELNKIDFAMCQQPTETLESFYNRQTVKPDLLLNGGFFSMDNGATIFTYRDNGLTKAYDPNLIEGIGIENGILRLGRYSESFTDFVCGYPVLIKDGAPVDSTVGSEIDYNARRTVLGYNDTYIFVITVENPGLRFSALKSLCLYFGITNAINLDGGGSTRLLKDGKRQTVVSYSRPIDNCVAIYLNKKAEVYRVQIGAFSKQSNAENLKNTIRGLADPLCAGYKSAYVRLIDKFYKVQVGAFSIKANAEKVCADLKEKGFSAFITIK